MSVQKLIIRQTQDHSINFYGIHLPKGAVYCILPERVYKGEFQPRAYVWVENLMLARNNRHFTVRMLTVNDRQPRSIYVDGSCGYANSLQNFIRALDRDSLSINRGATIREIRSIGAPRDRHVGKYIQRGVPSFETSSRIMTENSVTAGVRVGPVWLTEEGYKKQCMGLDAPDYNRNRPTPVHKSNDLESLSLDVSF